MLNILLCKNERPATILFMIRITNIYCGSYCKLYFVLRSGAVIREAFALNHYQTAKFNLQRLL